jgi:CBS domain-containing protein
METHHIRHLPVLEDGTLIGVVSARDFTRLQLEELGVHEKATPSPPQAYAH